MSLQTFGVVITEIILALELISSISVFNPLLLALLSDLSIQKYEFNGEIYKSLLIANDYKGGTSESLQSKENRVTGVIPKTIK